MVKAMISCDEWYPVYILDTVAVDVDYAIEFSQKFMDRYNKARKEFDAVQHEIGVAYGEAS